MASLIDYVSLVYNGNVLKIEVKGEGIKLDVVIGIVVIVNQELLIIVDVFCIDINNFCDFSDD